MIQEDAAVYDGNDHVAGAGAQVPSLWQADIGVMVLLAIQAIVGADQCFSNVVWLGVFDIITLSKSFDGAECIAPICKY